MIEVIIQTAGLIVLGVLWRLFTPQGLEADVLRRSLTTLVYVLAATLYFCMSFPLAQVVNKLEEKRRSWQ